MRILGLDYGSKTVGVAISDPLGITAQGVETIWRKQENHLRQTLARIEELVSEYHVEKIVLGYPKNMNNTIGERAQKSLEFKEMLERRTGLEVIMWDERLTTVAADRHMMGRASDNSRSQSYFNGSQCAQREPQAVSGSAGCCFYFAGISGFPVLLGD